MAELEKLYTVQEIAEMTSLTTRTIRNYLREGTLQGRKVGGQWRFTTEDIETMMDKGRVEKDMADENRKLVLNFLGGTTPQDRGTTQVCTIVDLYVPIDKAKEKSDRLCMLINTASQEAQMAYHYNYDKAEEKARYTLFASPVLISRAMEIFKLDNETNPADQI